MTGEQRQILDSIRRLQRRSLAVSWMRWALRGGFYLLLAAAIAVFLRPGLDLGAVALAVIIVALACGACIAYLRRASAKSVAKICDDQIGLRDRVSSSLDLMGVESPMVGALLEDTAGAAARVEPRAVFPFRMPREGWWMPLPLGLFVAAVFLPGWLGAGPRTDPALTETVETHARELAALIERERGKEPSQKREELLAKLEEFKQLLAREKNDKRDALADLSKLLEDLKKEREAQEKEKREIERQLESLKAGDQQKNLAADLKSGAYQDALNKLQEKIDDLKKQLEEKKDLSEEDLKRLEEQLKKLQELKAKLMRLQQMQLDLSFLGEAIDFLDDFEGEIGDVGAMLKDVKFLKPGCKCKNPGTCNGQCRGNRSGTGLKAGNGTMKDFLGQDQKRTDVTREEQRQTIRETNGQSSFTQTQVSNDGSKSALEAKEVFLSERKAAEDAIQRQEIPAGYREYLRKYFEGVQPDRRESDR